MTHSLSKMNASYAIKTMLPLSKSRSFEPHELTQEREPPWQLKQQPSSKEDPKRAIALQAITSMKAPTRRETKKGNREKFLMLEFPNTKESFSCSGDFASKSVGFACSCRNLNPHIPPLLKPTCERFSQAAPESTLKDASNA